ncbi:SAGA-associated factor 29 [Entomortierella parvispora]|uniref:SAGA-associated factor 29 n=1 Tax=Entomortierella parvispora TaxID=205924 RepID=A0A9P3HH82_9FUNG|nr:SAGA-associated factor 29 [Entomortierella parvispora]
MDRKRTNGGVATASAESTPRLLQQDEVPDEASLWTMTLQELVRVAELQDTNAILSDTLEKLPEGRPSRSLTAIQEATEKALEEREAIQRTLEGINLLLAMRDADSNNDDSPESKRKKRKIEAEGLVSNSKKMRRYSSAESGGIIPVGQQVAARTPKDKNKLEEWILARVLSYSADKNKYVVEDDEADDYGKKMTYTLSARSVIMIMDDQDSVPEFPAGHTVLALYPSTTCFYKAIVVQPPSKNKDYSTPLYRIKFDDDEGNERTAPPRMVLDYPKLK